MSQFVTRQPNGAGNDDNPIEAVGQSVAVGVADLLRSEGYTVEVEGITTGNVQIQSSINGSTWSNEGAALSADGRVTITAHNVAFIRADVTVATDVAVKLTVAGRQAAGYA